MSRNILYSHSEVSASVLHYTEEDSLDVKPIELTDIVSLSIDKNISNPSASFSITLLPGQNWKKLVTKGDWILVYVSIDGNKRLKLLGNVDRVSRSKTVDVESGKMFVKYSVHGRNFGKVFEKTNIYYNPYTPRRALINTHLIEEGIQFIGTPNEIIKKMLDVFLGGVSSIDELNQWFIPKELKKLILSDGGKDIKSDATRFYDILKQDLQEVVGYKAYRSPSALSGFLWNLLKQNSNDSINELFVELQYDKETGMSQPSIVFRMIPFADEDIVDDEDNEAFQGLLGPETSSPSIGNSFRSDIKKKSILSIGKINKFTKLDRVKITDDMIIFEDLGESDHVRFNFILLTMSGGPFFERVLGANLATKAADGGDPDIPKVNKDSIKRNGLLTRLENTEFGLYAKGANMEGNWQVLKAWNNLLAHWWENAHKLESGTMKILYNPDIELGKALEIKYDSGEVYLYYIEGYTINWSYPEAITMDLQLTRGRRLDLDKKFIEDANEGGKIYTGQGKGKR